MEKIKNSKFILLFVGVLASILLVIPSVALASTLTVTNTLAGKTYNAYVYFEKNGADYTISDSSVFKSSFDSFLAEHPDTFNVTDLGSGIHKVVPTSTFDENMAAQLAIVAMNSYASWKDNYVASKIANTDSVVFEGIPDGYYLVKSSAGTVLSMVTVDGEGEIAEKNTEGRYITLEYEVVENAVGYLEGTQIVTTARFNENYDKSSMKLELVNDYAYDHASLMGPGAFIVQKGTIMADGTITNLEVVPSSWYTLTQRDYGWTLTLTDDANFGVSTALVVTNYAVGVEGTDIYIGGVSEVEHLTLAHAKDVFGNAENEIGTASDTHRVLAMGLTKLGGDSDVVLDSAEFKMYRSATDTNPLYFVYDSATNTYSICESVRSGATTILSVGSATIKGLGDGEYWFEETKAPEGYNPLGEKVSHELTDDSDLAVLNNIDGTLHYVSGGLAVINRSGIIIPGTGGIGTLIFTLLGAGIIIGAIAYRMSRKRVSSSEVEATA